LKLSLFCVQDHYPEGARTVPQLYKQVIDQAVLAEVLGYAAFFSAEHHFHPYGVVPNPTALLCAIAQRTTRIRLGTAISILALQLSLDGPRRNDPRYPGAEEAMNAWFVVMNAWFVIMIILLGIGALTLHRYDVWRVLIWIAFGWFVLGALLLGYRGEHL
jgi:hypothetical protein